MLVQRLSVGILSPGSIRFVFLLLRHMNRCFSNMVIQPCNKEKLDSKHVGLRMRKYFSLGYIIMAWHEYAFRITGPKSSEPQRVSNPELWIFFTLAPRSSPANSRVAANFKRHNAHVISVLCTEFIPEWHCHLFATLNHNQQPINTHLHLALWGIIAFMCEWRAYISEQFNMNHLYSKGVVCTGVWFIVR